MCMLLLLRVLLMCAFVGFIVCVVFNVILCISVV